MLNSKIALVTGASAGIGRAIAHELVAEGAAVMFNGRRRSALEAATAGLDANRVGIAVGDMGRLEDVRRVVDETIAHFGRIDILINNAGSTPAGRIDTVTEEVWQSSIDLKLMGYIRTAREVLPPMRQRRWGRIVNIIGSAGYQPRATYIAGGVLNAGLLNFTKGLSNETAPDGVLVNGINPGPIRTERWIGQIAQRAELEGTEASVLEEQAAGITPVRRVGTPEDIAGLATFLCSDRASFITGTLFDIDGGGRVGI